MSEFEYPEEQLEVEKPKKRLFIWFPLFIGFVAGLGILIAGVLAYLNTPPEDFSPETIVSIEPGENVRSITEKLERENVVRSGSFLYFIIAFFHEPQNIKASTYVFDEPLDTLSIAERLTQGDFDTDLLRFTHYEGERAELIAERAEQVLPAFDSATFMAIAVPNEGRLFPDTYFIPETYTAEELAELMLNTFNTALAPYEDKVFEHQLSIEEIVILASILEREANSAESMKMVSGILQNRLAIDMPLQADASVEYILNKPLDQLTPDDLKIDSPYNTYTNIGLPPTAIGNPGLNAILAVLEPTQSDYYYYITDEDGIFHYAKTYREHLQNIDLYLR